MADLWDNNNQTEQNGDPFYNYANTEGDFAGVRGANSGFAAQRKDSLSAYIARTYLWMFAGLLVTFAVAMGVYVSLITGGLWYRIFTGSSAILMIVLIAELAVVIAMSALINKISAAVAGVFFFAYAALNGITFSLYLTVYGLGTVLLVFGVTALFFGGMAAVSLIFKLRLDTIRPFLFGGLILLILFGVLSAFLDLSGLEIFVSYLGIAIFLGYTAYDTSKIRANYQYYNGNTQMLGKASIFSALQLYLDFINLFLYILRILGKRKN